MMKEMTEKRRKEYDDVRHTEVPEKRFTRWRRKRMMGKGKLMFNE